MSEEKALITAEEQMVAEISPFQAKSNDLLARAEVQEVTDERTAAEAVALKKEITAHRTLVKDTRLGITRKIDTLKSAIMNKEAEVLLPLDKAQNAISDKILSYQEELERKRREEQERIDKQIASVTINDVYGLKTVEDVAAKGEKLKGVYAEMPEADQKNAQVKLAFTESVNKLSDRKAYLEEEVRQAAERAKLEAEAKKQSEERAKLEAEKAAAAEKERKIQAEKERLEREKQRRDAEAAAEKERQEREAAEKNQVKAGVRTVTSFEITDPAAVPREYCVPSDQLIRAAIKDGVSVPGVKVTVTRKV